MRKNVKTQISFNIYILIWLWDRTPDPLYQKGTLQNVWRVTFLTYKMHGGHTTCMAGPIRNMREPPHPHRLIRILSSACSLILSSALIIIRSGYHIRSQAQVAGSATALSYSNSYDTTEQLQLSSLRVRVVYPTYYSTVFSIYIAVLYTAYCSTTVLLYIE